jgi:hypothetical protein
MAKPRTHFEQVPLDIVKKIAGEEMPPETVTKRYRGISKKKVEKDFRGNHKQSKTNSRRSSRVEAPE